MVLEQYIAQGFYCTSYCRNSISMAVNGCQLFEFQEERKKSKTLILTLTNIDDKLH
jgi:hypothetical protein